MLVAGGHSGPATLNTAQVYNPATDTSRAAEVHSFVAARWSRRDRRRHAQLRGHAGVLSL